MLEQTSSAVPARTTSRVKLPASFLAAVGVLFPNAVVESLTGDDWQRELQRNRQMAEAPAATQERHRDALRVATLSRLKLLRRKLAFSLLLLLSAVVVGFGSSVVVRAIGLGFWPSAMRDLSIASMACFVWGSLGRMGWAGQTIRGDTAVERADDLIFRGLYWLGTFLGVLALRA